MSALMIIQCSGRKVQNGEPMPINDVFEQQLVPTRNILMMNYGIMLNNDMLMPAYRRYGALPDGVGGGQLYTYIHWLHALELIEQGRLNILIVSALYGLLEYDTCIANYNLQMNQARHLWMHNNLLARTLERYLEANPQINTLRSFLSNHYYEVISDTIPQVLNQWIPYSRGAQVAIQQINPFLEDL